MVVRSQWLSLSFPLLAAACGSSVDPGSDRSIATEWMDDALPFETPDEQDEWTCDLEAGVHEVSLIHDGEQRVFDLVVPEGLGEPAPLAIDFHGFTSNSEQERFLTDSDGAGVERGYLVAYPQGTGTPASWNAGVCCAEQEPRDDVGFAKLIVQDLVERGCADRKRAYAMGLSNGAFLAHRLACEAADVFAAVAPVSGVIGMDLETCYPFRPIPVFHTHGRLDSVVPYEGSPALGMRSVDETIEHWLVTNGCDRTALERTSEQGRTCSRYRQCDGEATVELCAYDLAGHIWPGGQETTRRIFDFFDGVSL